MPIWLITLLTGLGAIVALFVSNPENKPALVVSVVLTVLTAGLNAYDQYSTERTREEIQALAYEKLSVHTSQFLPVISTMIEVASDGWLPTNEEEFFSRQSIDLICHELNADALAPVDPKRTWLQRFAETTQEYKKILGEVLGDYSSQLPADLVRAIGSVERSQLLQWPTQWMGVRRIDQQEGFQRPPLLCYGLEDNFEEAFAGFLVLVKEIRKGEREYNLLKTPDWRKFPLPKRDSGRLGINRFGPEDLAKWAAEHPSAPSGKPPQAQKRTSHIAFTLYTRSVMSSLALSANGKTPCDFVERRLDCASR